MAWLSVTFDVDESRADAVSDALLEAGAASVDVSDAHTGTEREHAVFDEPGARAGAAWPRARVRALFDEGADACALVGAACERAGVERAPAFTTSMLPERDWVLESRAQFQPIRISSRLWVVPSWHEPPDAGAVNLLLDPGLAFGTGSHPTTRLCLRWLEREIRGGEAVIDYGCGSGILAIAALKLGAGSATGVDIDEDALVAARANALQNRVDASFQAAAAALRHSAPIVVANILARPLIVLAPELARLTAPGGRLALAGVLADQVDEVQAAYERWFAFDADAPAEKGWVLLAATRRS